MPPIAQPTTRGGNIAQPARPLLWSETAIRSRARATIKNAPPYNFKFNSQATSHFDRNDLDEIFAVLL